MSVEQGWPGLAQYTPAVPADWSPIPRTVQDALDELGGRSPGTSGETSFVYRPGGGSSPGVYVTAAALLAAVDSSDTAQNKVISVDASLVGGTAVINNGPWPDNITWQSGKGSVLAVLELDEGTTFAGLTYRFRNIAVAPHNTAVIWTIGAGTSANLVLDQGAVLAPSGAGHVFADVAGTLSISEFESIVGDGTAGHELFEVEATGLLNVFLFDASAFNANASKQGAAPGGAMNLGFDGASQSTVSVTQVPVPVTLNFDPQPTFVFAPGAATIPGSNVFTDWAALMAAAALSPGPKRVALDGSGGAMHATAGVWNVDNITFTTSQFLSTANRTLHIDDGSVWTWTHLGVEGVALLSMEGTTVPCTTLSATQSFLDLRNGQIVEGAGGTQPFVAVTAGTLALYMQGNSGINTGANPSFSVAAGATVASRIWDNSAISQNSFTGLGTLTAALSSSASCGTQAGLTTLTITNRSLASLTAYTAGTAGNWNPVPTLVNAALDQLAAPNSTQAANNTGTGTGTITITTGNITKAKSGKMVVTANIAGESTGPGTITLQLIRDAATPIGNPIAVTALSANDDFSLSMTFIDTAPDTAAHTYKFTATASAGNITCAATSGQLSVFEL